MATNLFDFNASADEAFIRGAKSSEAMGFPAQKPTVGLQPPSMGMPRTQAALAAIRPPTLPSAPEPVVGYNKADDTFWSAGKVIPGSNLTIIDEADKAGLFNVDNSGKLPPGYSPTPVSKLRAWKEAEAQNRGFMSAAGEVGKQALAGVADLGSMVAGATAFAARRGSPVETAAGNVNRAIEGAMQEYTPDVYGRNVVSESLISGARGLAPSAAGMAASVAFPIAGTAGTGAVFGGAQGWETYQKALAAGKTPDEAMAIARQTGLVEGLGEAAADRVGGLAFKGLASAVKGGGKRAAINMLANPAVQIGTEFGQGYTQAAIEQGAGISQEDPFAVGTQGAKAAAGMTALMGGIGLGVGAVNRKRLQIDLLKEIGQQDYTAPATPYPTPEPGLPALGYTPAPAQIGFNGILSVPDQSAIPMGYDPASAVTTTAGQEWQGLGVQPSGPVGIPSIQRPAGPAAPASIGQIGREWQQNPAAQPSLEGGYQSLEEQRLAAQVAEGQQLSEQARKDALEEQRIAAVRGTMPAPPSGASPAAVAAPVTPVPAQAAPEPFNRSEMRKKKRTELALQAQDLGIQVKGNMSKDAIITAIEQKVTGKTTEAAPAAAPAPTTTAEDLEDLGLDEKAADAGIGMTKQVLQSAARSVPGAKPRGKITVLKEALAGVVRSLRMPRAKGESASATPVIYKAGTATVDREQTSTNAAVMSGMRDAALAVADAYDTYSQLSGNAVPTDRKVPDGAGVRNRKAGETAKALQVAAQQLRNAVENLIAVSGSAANANALISAFKTRVQTDMSKGTTQADKAKRWTSMDVNLSRAWKLYNDGLLDSTENLVQVSTGEKRNSWEVEKQGASESPLVSAASTGVARNAGPKTPKEKGIMGVLAYLQRHGNTPFERMLASAVSRALRKTDKMPKVVFDVGPTEHASYVPADDTIHLRETSSAEEALHEALHSALQWVVHTQPNNPAVQQLRQALKDLMAYDRNKLKSENAKNAYDIIAGLVKKGGEGNLNAAMLELVSYGNTMPDFTAALRSIPSTQDQQFKSLATKLFDMVAKLVQKFLGVSNTVANDVLDATMRLLEDSTMSSRAEAFGEAGKGQKLNAATGQTLYAAVSSSTQPGNAVQPGMAPNSSYAKTSKGIWNSISTEMFFRALGWDKVPAKVLKASAEMAEAIKTNSPTLTRWISYVNANFAVPIPLREALLDYKTDRHIGAQMTDLLANYIESKPRNEVLALVAYLDGQKDALKDHPNLKEVADMVEQHRQAYIAEIRHDRTREFFKSLKFSDAMAFAKDTEGLASRSLGARKLNELLRHTSDPNVQDVDVHFPRDADGNPITDGSFIRMLQATGPAAGKFAGYYHVDLVNKNGVPAGMVPEQNGLQWRLDKKTGKNQYRMAAVRSARYALEQENKANEVANALRNTMSILAANYASNRLTDSLADKGADLGVVFDNIQELEKFLGSKVSPKSILELSSATAKSSEVQGWFRSKHQWVRVPTGPTYGELAGKLVNGSVWASIEDMTDRRPLHNFNVAHDAMRIFKKSKTVYNPGTHLGNVGTNFTLAMMHDIPMSTVGTAMRLLWKYSRNPDAMSKQDRDLMHQFMNSGAMLGDYSSIEVKQALYDAMKDAISENEPSGVSAKVAGWIRYEAMKKSFIGSKMSVGLAKTKAGAIRGDEMLTNLYAAEDNAFRLAAFLTNLNEQATGLGGPQNLTEKEYRAAGTFARDAFLDYDIDSKAVKILRSTVLPFVSWTYAIMPVLGHIALHKPWKLANVMLGYYIIEQAMAAAAGDDDEEMRKRAPEYIRNRLFGVGPYAHIRVPFMGDAENPVYFKLGAYIPLANVADPQPTGFMGLRNWPQQISPTGPFIAAILGAGGGIDPYTGKPLSPPTDSDWEAFADRSALIAKQFTPPWAPTALDVAGIVRGTPEKGVTGADAFTGLKAARDIGGLKLYQFNMTEAAVQQEIAAAAIRREFEKEIAAIRRKELRYEQPDWDAFYQRRDELLARQNEKISKAKGEE